MLLVVDWWEKLSGASLALSSIIRLCKHSSHSLVAPHVSASLFVVPAASHAWPLSAYYNVPLIRAALSPQRLVEYTSWQRHAREIGAPLVLTVVYSDFSRTCRAEMRRVAQGSWECPEACTNGTGVRRAFEAVRTWLDSATAVRACVTAAAMRQAIAGNQGPVLSLMTRHKAVALLNFRRHDDGRPMLPIKEALRLRRHSVQPARSVLSAAAAFLAQHSLQAAPYAAVQLRANHVAHQAHLVGRRQLANTSSNCAQRTSACVRRLGRVVRRVAPASATVVASDLATLFRTNQDGASHRKKAYMKECLRPALPSLQRWHARTGVSFNCTAQLGKLWQPTSSVPRGVSATETLRNRGPADACDPGWLGLVDLVLASNAAHFAAIDVRSPWPSAFVEWIVQRRAIAGRNSTLVKC
jgi:hypothetical protein